MSWLVELLKAVGVALGVLAPVVTEVATSQRAASVPPPLPSAPTSFADVDREVDAEVRTTRRPDARSGQ